MHPLGIFALACFTLGTLYALRFAVVFAVRRLGSRFKGAVAGVVLVSVGLFGLWGLVMEVMDGALPRLEVNSHRRHRTIADSLSQSKTRKNLPPVTWSTEPKLYVLLVLVWTAIGLGLVVLGWRKLKRAWSAED